MKTPNGSFKIMLAIGGPFLLAVIGYVSMSAVTSVDAAEVRQIVQDKFDPLHENQKEMRLELREQSKKIDLLNENQTKALTILDRIDKKR